MATTVFATLVGDDDVPGWNQFNHGHVSFWAWTAFDVVTPLLFCLLDVRDRA